MTVAPPRPPPLSRAGRLSASGPCLQDEQGNKVRLQGVTYGPFPPNSCDEPWPEAERLEEDLRHIARLGFNCLRVYGVPSDRVLEGCAAHSLQLLVSIPWTQHVDFRGDRAVQNEARRTVREIARRFAHHPQVCGFLVGNEFEKTLVRWMTSQWTQTFVEELIALAKSEAPQKLVSYASYPSAEYLIPRNADFIALNVFLEKKQDFTIYLQHLQVLAEGRPLIISEFGLDTKQNGEAAQAEAFQWFHETCRRAHTAGTFWYAYTDEWFNGGELMTEWDFGLVTRDRQEKAACATAARLLNEQPIPSPGPRFSVVVCTHNGAATLQACLEGLHKQTWPQHEILVIDDGSTDRTDEIAKSFRGVQYVRQEFAGLSAARNLGWGLATGDIIAYTDDDCIPDPDWLANLAPAFNDPSVAAAGGPNLPPPARNTTESIVALAPGAPSHVLVNDLEAEHLPGCNLAVRRSCLEAIGGFREEFRTAGDDVDVCWRLLAAGGVLRFVPAAFVWHHRRATVSAYLRQQRGYGRAEALLMKYWPERFAWIGGARWRGAIYGHPAAQGGNLTVDRGRFCSALFPTVYTGHSTLLEGAFAGLPWSAGVLASLAASLLFLPFLALSVLLLFAGVYQALRSARTQRKGQRFSPQTKGLLILLNIAQPLWRDAARLGEMLRLRVFPRGRQSPFLSGSSPAPLPSLRRWQSRAYWSEAGVEREAWLIAVARLAADRGITLLPDETGQIDFILSCGRHQRALQTVTEFHERGRRLTRVAWGKLGFWGRPGLSSTLLVTLVCFAPWQVTFLSALAMGLVNFWLQRQLHARVVHLIDDAALRCGMRPLAPLPAAHPDSSGISLASPRNPSELLES